MILADHFYDPGEQTVKAGLGLLTNLCIIPHYHKLSTTWINKIQRLFPHLQLLGIDEETGIINDAEGGGWKVYGKGNAYLVGDQILEFQPGCEISYVQLKQPCI